MILLLSACAPLENNTTVAQSQLVVPPQELTGFQRADGPQPLSFPADHGPHPGYQTEWWYYTGNLETASGRHFGYQLTFFRRALVPPNQIRFDRASEWAFEQVYLAHFALTDVAGENHQEFQRFARGAAGLAGAQAEPYRIWLEDWSVELIAPNRYHLTASQDDFSLDLILNDRKGPVLQGDRGYSQKGPDPGNASYYISQTRLQTEGRVHVVEETHSVQGTSWMDHEFSTSALSAGQIGWDWFSIQLANDTELMLFQIRREDGSIDPFSSGTLIDPSGSTRKLEQDDFQIAVLDTWRSPDSDAEYPSGWQIVVPDENLTLTLQPYLADQEMNLNYTYWEGAVRITGERNGEPLTGDGYVELTGYAGSFEGEF